MAAVTVGEAVQQKKKNPARENTAHLPETPLSAVRRPPSARSEAGWWLMADGWWRGREGGGLTGVNATAGSFKSFGGADTVFIMKERENLQHMRWDVCRMTNTVSLFLCGGGGVVKLQWRFFLVRHRTKFVWMPDCQIGRPGLSLYGDARPHIARKADRDCNYTYAHTPMEGGGVKDGRQKERRVCQAEGLLRSWRQHCTISEFVYICTLSKWARIVWAFFFSLWYTFSRPGSKFKLSPVSGYAM